jgi:hypothetical protein
MAKSVISVTQSFQKVATGQCIITVCQRGDGYLVFNETASDTAAYNIASSYDDQFEQMSAVDTYVKATGDGWEIIVDGIL